MFLSLDSFRRPVPRLNRANSANSLHFADYHPSAPPLAASLKDSLVHLSPLSFPTPRSRLDFVHSLLDALASPSGNSTIVLEFLDFESSTATRNILVLIRWTNDALETADFAFLAAIVNLFSCILLSPLVIPSMDTHFKDIWRGTFVSCSVALNRRERPSNFQALSHRASTLSNFITTNNRSLLSHAHPAAIHSVPHPCYRASSYHGGANSGASVTHSSDVTLFKLAAPTAEARRSTSSILRRSRVKRHGVSSSLYRVRWAGWIKDNEHVRREVPLLKVPIKVEVWTDADEIDDDDDDDGVFL